MRPNQSENSLGPRHTFHMCKVSRAWNWPLTWSYTVELHLDLHMCLTCLVAWLSTRSTLNFNSYWFSHCTLNIPHNLKMCTALKWYCPAFGWQLCCQQFTWYLWKKAASSTKTVPTTTYCLMVVLNHFKAQQDVFTKVRLCCSLDEWGNVLWSPLVQDILFFFSPTCPDHLWNNGYKHFSANSYSSWCINLLAMDFFFSNFSTPCI